MIKAVIFDAGGVIVNSLDSLLFKAIAKKFGIDFRLAVSNLEGLLKYYHTGKISSNDFWKLFSQRVKKEPPKGYEYLWIEKYASNFLKNKYVFKIIDRLRENGYKLAVLSNTIPEHANYNRKHHTFDGFDVVVLSNEVGLRKPDKRVYMLVLKRLRIEPQECVYIDDRPEYLKPAAKLGMKIIYYRNPKQLEVELRKLYIKL